ncbi:MAG: dienelactone hydrolase family protein [Armatimonadota bacterium]
MSAADASVTPREVRIPVEEGAIMGNLVVPADAAGIVLFAHGSGSGRHSPRSNLVAQMLQRAGFATLLMDLLTAAEERVDVFTREHRFNIGLLARRLVACTNWLTRSHHAGLPIGYFGSSTGAAAAIVAAAQRDDDGAIVSRGGRPDLAAEALERFAAPILLIVGGNDPQVLELNRAAMRRMRARAELTVIPGAGHLFEEPGQLEQVARLAAEFFQRHLRAVRGS